FSIAILFNLFGTNPGYHVLMQAVLPQNFEVNYTHDSYKGRILIPFPLYLLTTINYFLFHPVLFYWGYNVCRVVSAKLLRPCRLVLSYYSHAHVPIVG